MLQPAKQNGKPREIQEVTETIGSVDVHIGARDLKLLAWQQLESAWMRVTRSFPIGLDDFVLRNRKWAKIEPRSPIDCDALADEFFKEKKPGAGIKFDPGKGTEVYLHVLPDKWREVEEHLTRIIDAEFLAEQGIRPHSKYHTKIAQDEECGSTSSSDPEPSAAEGMQLRKHASRIDNTDRQGTPMDTSSSKNITMPRRHQSETTRREPDHQRSQSRNTTVANVNMTSKRLTIPKIPKRHFSDISLDDLEAEASMQDAVNTGTVRSQAKRHHAAQTALAQPAPAAVESKYGSQCETVDSPSAISAYYIVFNSLWVWATIECVILAPQKPQEQHWKPAGYPAQGAGLEYLGAPTSAKLKLNTSKLAAKYGAFKRAQFGTLVADEPIFQGDLRAAGSSDLDAIRVCAKQVLYPVPPKTPGAAPQKVAYPGTAQAQKLMAEVRCLVWARALLASVYKFIDESSITRLGEGQESLSIPRLRFVNAALAVSTVGDGSNERDKVCYLLEEEIPTASKPPKWRKYLNNDSAVPKPQFHAKANERAQFLAFSQHVQYWQTCGDGELLTDPQIVTNPSLGDRQLFASGNLPSAHATFAQQHKCNRFCTVFELPKIEELDGIVKESGL
ncbi:hypothetical protein BN946_scf184783.g29 [Trametes cinnabarina]|uniref:Alpha-type protein kinase domain-containing protein n=1 Tax=Pycnoporus cinnabarinus TaxID=5643 RepID=A0A060S6Z7_PYCCI|nr:hypothetical protein BN946_scf184783.g29 [Trametes cinnabarina]